jgi:hypothetical protein
VTSTYDAHLCTQNIWSGEYKALHISLLGRVKAEAAASQPQRTCHSAQLVCNGKAVPMAGCGSPFQTKKTRDFDVTINFNKQVLQKNNCPVNRLG